VGIDLVPGLSGGLARPELVAPPKENEGRAVAPGPSSKAETGRRGDLREYEGVGVGDGAGKVKAGSGRGPWWLWAPPCCAASTVEAMLGKPTQAASDGCVN
jgi:hypothetical protein